MKRISRKSVKNKNRGRITLTHAELRKCDSGIRRLLSMTEDEVIKGKAEDDKRISAELELLRKPKRRPPSRQKAKEMFKRKIEPLPHPIFGPIGIEVIGRRKPKAKIRAIVNFVGNEDDLRSLGISVHSGVQNIFSITATRDQIATLVSQAATQKVSLPRIFFPLLHDSVPTAEIDQIHAVGTRGNGTIVGVIDSALHVVHHAFRDPNGTQHNTRVRYMWVQDPDNSNAPGQNPEQYFQDTVNHPNSPDFTGLNYGRIYDENAINAALALANPYGSGTNQISMEPSKPNASGVREAEHGTHVTGIAAGGGHNGNWTTTPTNIGAAPLADIVHVCYRWSAANVQNGIYETDILNALNFILRIATHDGQPVVINNSYGLNVGPHNGLTDFDQALNAMLDSFTGRSIIYATGNDNNDQGFRKGTIAAGSTLVVTLTPWATPVWLEIWYNGPDLDFRIDFGTNNTGWTTPPNEFHGNVGTISVDVDRDVQSSTGLKNLRIYIQNATISPWSINLRNSDPNNDVAYWAWTGGQGSWASINGNMVDENTLSDTCCARAILSVGSCAKQVSGNIEEIANYSGRGPTIDGRIKPEITAVGGINTDPIMSADSLTSGGYTGKVGTSMAAPLVAGAIALLLEGNPDLDQDTIKGLLTKTADQTNLDINPDAAGYDPNERNAFGFGRLRMLDSFQHSLPLVDVDVWVKTADDDFGFEPYPGGCFCHAPEVKILDQSNVETSSLDWTKDYSVRVKVHNLGDTAAVKTKVQIKYTRPWTAPDTWTPCTDASGTAITQEINIGALDSTEFTFDKKWQPKQGEVPSVDTDWGDHFCLLVETDHANDPIKLYSSSGATGEAWQRNIKGTNNIALRNIAIH